MPRPVPSLALPMLVLALAATPRSAQPPAPPAAPARSALTIERLASYPNLAGTVPSSPAWSPDGSRAAFLWNKEGWPFRDIWVTTVADATPLRATDMLTTESSAGAPGAEPRLQGGVSALVWASNTDLVFLYRGAVYGVVAAGGPPTLLLPRASRGGLTISPDRRTLAYLQDGDVWVAPVDRSGEPRRLTQVGQPPLGQVPGARFPAPDVEFTAIRWSPTGRHLAVQYNDRSKVRKVLIPNYLGDETTVTSVRRDFPGDRDFIRRVAVVAVDTGGVSVLPLQGDTDRRVTGVAWSPDGRQLLVDQSSEDAVDWWLQLVTLEGLGLRELWHDRRETRVLTNWTAEWQTDGRGVLFISDHEGGFRVYALRLDAGAAPAPLTPAGVEVVGESGPSPLLVSGTDVFFVSTAKDAAERQVFRVSTARGAAPAQVTSLPGTHAPSLAPGGRTLATVRSDDVTPPELYLLDARTSGGERRVTTSPTAEFASVQWQRPRYVTFPSRTDGATLHGRILEPPNLDRSRKYPVILGPVYANTVRNRWVDREEWRGAFNTLQEYFALEGGYIGFHVDVRGSVGYGRGFQDQLLRDYGGIDVEDLHSAVEYLKTLPYVDGARIGVWGSSYGGLMTAMSLFKKPGVYAAGVAGAPATNVRHATTGEVKVARLPGAPGDTYDAMSAVTHAAGLRDPLLIVQGMQDDVVLFKDSVTLAEALLRNDRSFDFAFVPASVHNWTLDPHYARYLLGRVAAHFDRYLKPAGTGAAAR